MTVKCITNQHGFSLLTAEVEVFSPTVEPFTVTAIIDTGASVALLSPSLIERLKPEMTARTMTVHGLTGNTQRHLFNFGVEIEALRREGCIGIALEDRFAGYDLVLGLDVLLHTGLTLSPNGEHKLAA